MWEKIEKQLSKIKSVKLKVMVVIFFKHYPCTYYLIEVDVPFVASFEM